MSLIYTQPESKTTSLVIERLNDHFHLHQEVKGIHSITNRKKRIDFVMVPKSSLIKFGFPSIPVGLELKSFNLLDGNKKQVVLLSKQAVDYRYTRFKMRSGYHFLPLILMHPPMLSYLNHSNSDRPEFNEGFVYSLSRTLGQWFVGELIFPTNHDGFEIHLSASKYFKWSNGRGKRLNLSWGFEKYEEIKNDLRGRNLGTEEYESELLKHVDLLGI